MRLIFDKIYINAFQVLFFQLFYGGVVTGLIYLMQGENSYTLTGPVWHYILIGQAIAIPVQVGVWIFEHRDNKRKERKENQKMLSDLIKDYVINKS